MQSTFAAGPSTWSAQKLDDLYGLQLFDTKHFTGYQDGVTQEYAADVIVEVFEKILDYPIDALPEVQGSATLSPSVKKLVGIGIYENGAAFNQKSELSYGELKALLTKVIDVFEIGTVDAAGNVKDNTLLINKMLFSIDKTELNQPVLTREGFLSIIHDFVEVINYELMMRGDGLRHWIDIYGKDNAIYELKLARIFPEDYFERLDTSLSRSEGAAIIVKAKEILIGESARTTGNFKFTDTSDVNAQKLVGEGIAISSINKAFNGESVLTRGDYLQWLSHTNKAETVYTDIVTDHEWWKKKADQKLKIPYVIFDDYLSYKPDSVWAVVETLHDLELGDEIGVQLKADQAITMREALTWTYRLLHFYQNTNYQNYFGRKEIVRNHVNMYANAKVRVFPTADLSTIRYGYNTPDYSKPYNRQATWLKNPMVGAFNASKTYVDIKDDLASITKKHNYYLGSNISASIVEGSNSGGYTGGISLKFESLSVKANTTGDERLYNLDPYISIGATPHSTAGGADMAIHFEHLMIQYLSKNLSDAEAIWQYITYRINQQTDDLYGVPMKFGDTTIVILDPKWKYEGSFKVKYGIEVLFPQEEYWSFVSPDAKAYNTKTKSASTGSAKETLVKATSSLVTSNIENKFSALSMDWDVIRTDSMDVGNLIGEPIGKVQVTPTLFINGASRWSRYGDTRTYIAELSLDNKSSLTDQSKDTEMNLSEIIGQVSGAFRASPQAKNLFIEDLKSVISTTKNSTTGQASQYHLGKESAISWEVSYEVNRKTNKKDHLRILVTEK